MNTVTTAEEDDGGFERDRHRVTTVATFRGLRAPVDSRVENQRTPRASPRASWAAVRPSASRSHRVVPGLMLILRSAIVLVPIVPKTTDSALRAIAHGTHAKESSGNN